MLFGVRTESCAFDPTQQCEVEVSDDKPLPPILPWYKDPFLLLFFGATATYALAMVYIWTPLLRRAR